MTTVLFILATFASCALALMAARAGFGRYWIVSPAMACIAYFVLVMLPGFFLAETGPSVIDRALFAHTVWFAGLAVSSLVVSILRDGSYSRSSGGNFSLTGSRQLFYVFIFLSVPALVFTFVMLGRVPLFIGVSSLFGESGDLTMHAARRMNTLEHRAGDTVYFGQGYLRQIYAVVGPVFWVALYLYNNWNRVSYNKVLLNGLLAFFVMAGALNGQIWMSVNIMIFFVMAMVHGRLAKTDSVLTRGLLLRCFYIYIGLIIFISLYRYFQFLQGRDSADIVAGTLRRIYLPGAIQLFGIFPDHEPFRYGATWLNDLRGILPGSVQSFAYEVHYLVHGGGWGFTLSPGIVASSYVNFGFIGVFFVSLVLGSVYGLLFKVLVTSNSALRVAIALYLSHRFMLAMPGDIPTFVVTLITAGAMYFSYGVLKFGLGRARARSKVAARRF